MEESSVATKYGEIALKEQIVGLGWNNKLLLG